MQCNSSAPRTKSGSPKRGHRNQIPASHSQYQPNPIRALDYKQPHSHITVQTQATDSWGTYQVLCPSLSGSTLVVKNPSTSSEEALVRGTSHIQCNPLTLSLNFHQTLPLVGIRFSYVFTNRKANCPAIITDSSHKYFRAPKILIRQSSHAYANFIIMPMPGIYSCMLKHVTFQDQSILQLMQILQTCQVYIHACQII
ncbi:hypothetical protein M9H77_02577 [Catharanthus roseus]|uniref:Uncharacterized protein n=1 Tax=Catharanthus roseus TaxID=4058 RepID=A0ACC0C8R7_CATRO|nr:hypothetical protein M9H77_02577 [Catharanthus roseus]